MQSVWRVQCFPAFYDRLLIFRMLKDTVEFAGLRCFVLNLDIGKTGVMPVLELKVELVCEQNHFC